MRFPGNLRGLSGAGLEWTVNTRQKRPSIMMAVLRRILGRGQAPRNIPNRLIDFV